MLIIPKTRTFYSHPSPHTSSVSRSKGLEWAPLASPSVGFPLVLTLLSVFIPGRSEPAKSCEVMVVLRSVIVGCI